MREIKLLGNMRLNNDNRNYKYSLFECSHCKTEVVRKTKDGKNATLCSRKCYAETRNRRGAYKEYIVISGYKYIQCPSHPNATLKGYVAEHRIILENKMGRYLGKEEDVHHKNFNKLDNRECNLLALTKSEHGKLHQSMKVRNTYGKFTI